jgi:phosphoribosylformimino-5-aminoimidazole carboxamide ribonucleotide (ProFAR) isomerase
LSSLGDRSHAPRGSILIPSIDLCGGRVVTLRAGELTPVPGVDPLELAERWARYGPLNLVDLDAALGRAAIGGENTPNGAAITAIAHRHESRIAGGVRSLRDVELRLAQGADKVILASALFGDRGLDRGFLALLSARVRPERLILALDVRAGEILAAGWERGTGLAVEEVAAELAPFCSEFVLTAIEREGTARGPDLDQAARLLACTQRPVAVAGGIATEDHVAAVAALGARAIVGLAVHAGTLDLTRASRALGRFVGPETSATRSEPGR